MKTNDNNNQQVNRSVLKLQRSTLDKQTVALFVTMMVMAVLLVVVSQFTFLSQSVTSATLIVLGFGMMYLLPVFIYKNVRLAWTINDKSTEADYERVLEKMNDLELKDKQLEKDYLKRFHKILSYKKLYKVKMAAYRYNMVALRRFSPNNHRGGNNGAGNRPRGGWNGFGRNNGR